MTVDVAHVPTLVGQYPVAHVEQAVPAVLHVAQLYDVFVALHGVNVNN